MAEAQEIRAHAATCPQCGLALHHDESAHRRLGLLRGGEPRVDVSERVLEQLEQVPHTMRLPRPKRRAFVAMAFVAVGLLVAATNGHIRRTVKRLGAIIP